MIVTGPEAWDFLSAAAWLPAALAALAVLLAWPGPVRLPDPGLPRRVVPRWLLGRADAPPLGRRLLWGAFVGVAAGSVLTRVGLPLAVGAGLLTTVAAAAVIGWLEPSSTREARRRRIADSPQALDLLASCLAAGLPVRAALRAVAEVFDGPLGGDLDQVLRLTELGHDDAAAWRTLADHEQLGAAALDLARSVETGAMLVESLLLHAEIARDQRCGQVEAAARRVGVRSVLPLMLCFLPSFLLLGIVPTVASAVLNALHV